MKTIDIQCSSCKGTGLYKGMAERGDCAVVCHNCNGTGKSTFSYEEFTGRKKRDGVTRVFLRSCGYGHTDKDITTSDGVKVNFSQAGATYEEWLNGATPKPVKEIYCPYIWNNRGMGNEPLERCRQTKYSSRISDCDFFNDKANCWKEYEKK